MWTHIVALAQRTPICMHLILLFVIFSSFRETQHQLMLLIITQQATMWREPSRHHVSAGTSRAMVAVTFASNNVISAMAPKTVLTLLTRKIVVRIVWHLLPLMIYTFIIGSSLLSYIACYRWMYIRWAQQYISLLALPFPKRNHIDKSENEMSSYFEFGEEWERKRV